MDLASYMVVPFKIWLTGTAVMAVLSFTWFMFVDFSWRPKEVLEDAGMAIVAGMVWPIITLFLLAMGINSIAEEKKRRSLCRVRSTEESYTQTRR